jgi:hypothetical protein
LTRLPYWCCLPQARLHDNETYGERKNTMTATVALTGVSDPAYATVGTGIHVYGTWEIEITAVETTSGGHRLVGLYNTSDPGKQHGIVLSRNVGLGAGVRTYEFEAHFKAAHWNPGLPWNNDAPARSWAVQQAGQPPPGPVGLYMQYVGFWTGEDGSPRPGPNDPHDRFHAVQIMFPI